MTVVAATASVMPITTLSPVRRAGIVLAAAAGYLALALFAWWHVWTGGVSHTLAANGWGDPAQQVWYLAWVPHALGAGLNPFVSHAMFAPGGINLMANSSILFPAFALSPVTVLFGPVVAFNVGVVLAPVLSGLAAYAVFRRYTTFVFGAWLGGLFYGFSPFVLNDLGAGHLHVTVLVFPPLILAVLDDLVVRQRGSAWSRGVLLGLLVTAQALTSLEVLAMVVMLSIVGVAVLALFNRSEVRPRLRRVLIGFGFAAAVAVVLLAWPAEVLFFGPRRYHGSVFISPESYVVFPFGTLGVDVWPDYLGIPLFALFALATWRMRSGVVRLAALLFVVAFVLSMGRSFHLTPKIATGIPLPDRLLSKAPLLESLLPVRFVLLSDLFAGLALAVGLGGLRDLLAWRRGRAAGSESDDGADAPNPSGAPPSDRAWRARLSPSLVAGVVGVLVLASPAFDTHWPYPARQVAVPAVYRSSTITGLAPRSILLAYPVMNGFAADPMIWQAADGMPYEMVAGYGFIPSPGAHPYGSLPASPITELFADAEIGLLSAGLPPSRVDAVRSQLRSLGVSEIVILRTGAKPTLLAQDLAVITRQRPVMIDGAWVWLDLRLGGH
jgi:hypothetical protein